MVLQGDIVITTFVNPHLFWIVSKGNPERAEILEEIDNLLDYFCLANVKNKSSFDIGDFVAVKVHNKLYRAIIEHDEGELVDLFKNKRQYICWLVDYGTMVKSGKDMWKLPPFIRTIPAQAHQASLYNVAYATEGLSYNEIARPLKNYKSICHPTYTSKVAAIDLLDKCTDLQFQFVTKECGILFGDILYKEDEGSSAKSLTRYLIENHVLMAAPELSEEIRTSINIFKDSQIKFILDICSSSPYIWETEKKMAGDDKPKPKSTVEDASPNKAADKPKSDAESGSGTKDACKPNPKAALKALISKKLGRAKSNGGSEKNANELKPTEAASHNRGTVKPELEEVMTDKNTQKPKEDVDVTMSRLAQIKKLINDKYQNRDIFNINQENSRESDTSSMTSNTSYQRKSLYETSSSESTHKQCLVKKKNIVRKHVSFKNRISEDEPINSVGDSKGSFDEVSSDEGSVKITRRKPSNQSSGDEHCSVDRNSESQSCNEESSTSTSGGSWTSSDAHRHNKNSKHLGCSCANCSHWTENDDWNPVSNFQENKIRTLKMPATNINRKLFKSAEEMADSNIHILSLEYSSLTKIQQQITRKILVHSQMLPRPMKHVSEVHFHQLVHQSLAEMGYKEAKLIQLYSWPALFRNLHAFMISGPKTGKTVAYLPVLCTFILERSARYSFTCKSAGAPIVVILCSNSNKCENIYDLVLVLLGKGKAKVSLITYPLIHVNTSQVDILVTTPLILADLLKSNAINFKRLCHFVLEDADRIFARFRSVCGKITGAIESTLKSRIDLPSVQMIVCAEHWTGPLQNLYKRLRCPPFICIGNLLEAAIYGQVRFNIEFMSSAQKERKLKLLLKETYAVQRSLIVCREVEIEDVEEFLRLKGIEASVVKKDMSKDEVLDLERAWNSTCSGEHTVLVCTDFELNNILTVTKVSFLLHYSLPSSWSRFIHRFACMLENCHSPLQQNETSTPTKSTFLCDEASASRMNKFLKYFHPYELKNQNDVWKVCVAMAHDTEEEEKLNMNVGLCDKQKLFGKCQEPMCSWRHAINKEADFTKQIPFEGKVKFKILNVHDVTKYSIRILEHIDKDNNVNQFTADCNLTKDLTEALSKTKRRVQNFVLGRWYTYQDDDETYKRCELIEILADNNCKIKVIDSGLVTETSISSLFMLPKGFDNLHKPASVLDMYLADLVPPYQDDCFSAKAFYKLKTKMETNDYRNKIYTGEIRLQLAATLWLNNVREEVVLSDQVISGSRLSSMIKTDMLAVASEKQLLLLRELCKQANIDVPVLESNVSIGAAVVEKQPKPQWAYLSLDDLEEVYFCSAVSPDEFYVCLKKFYQLIKSLQKEMNADLQRPNYPTLKHVHVGTVCLAKDEEDNENNEYSRALILNVENNDVEVFFVDYGYHSVVPIKNLRYIQNTYITKLPFQAIQCRLHGLKPILDEWHLEAVNLLYQYGTEPESSVFRTLILKVAGKKTPQIQNRSAYNVLLKDGYGTKHILLNSLMIDCGFAVLDGDALPDFEITVADDDEHDDIERGETSQNYHIPDEFEDESDEFDLVINDPQAFFYQVSHFGDPTPSKNISTLPAIESGSSVDYRTPIVAAPPVDYYTPDLVWSQTDSDIKIAIKLAGIQEYKAAVVKGRSFQFSTVRDTKTYKLSLLLYAPVQLVQHSVVGPEIRATLKKTNDAEWPRLVLANQRLRNIRYDVDSIDVKEEEKKLFLQLPKELDEGLESNGEEDGEIDVMYHNVSDIESDFDGDLEDDSDV